MFFQKLCHLQCVFRMSYNSQMKGLKSLKEQKGIKRRKSRPHIAKKRHSCFNYISDIADRAQCLYKFQTVITWISICNQWKFVVFFPVKFTRIHYNSSNGRPMPSNKLCGRINDNIDSMLYRF